MLSKVCPVPHESLVSLFPLLVIEMSTCVSYVYLFALKEEGFVNPAVSDTMLSIIVIHKIFGGVISGKEILCKKVNLLSASSPYPPLYKRKDH